MANNYVAIGERVVEGYNVGANETSVNINLYQNSAEPNRVDKTNYITPTNPAVIAGTFKAPFNITHPTITILRVSLIAFNYVMIRYPIQGQTPQLRYYFVSSVTAVSDTLYEIELELDVLMTYKEAIADCEAFVERNEFEYNDLLIDEKRVIEAGIEVSDITIQNNILVDSRLGENTPSGIVAISGFSIYVVHN